MVTYPGYPWLSERWNLMGGGGLIPYSICFASSRIVHLATYLISVMSLDIDASVIKRSTSGTYSRSHIL